MFGLLVALAGTASAQNLLLSDAVNCLQDNANPVAGTSGVENALSALRVNSQTYSATRFAEERLFPHWEETQEDRVVRIAYEHNQNLGVARVPLWFSDVECPDEYRFSTSPVDLYATNIGAVGRIGQVGFYYSASVTFGTTALGTARYRGATHGIMPLLSAYALFGAPLAGGAQVIQGTSAYATDWLGGATLDNPYLRARVGYVRSQGMHVSVSQPQSALFANGVVRNGFNDIEQYAGGVQRLRLGALSDVVGVSSLFAKGVPLTEDNDGVLVQLRSGHIEQSDIGGWVDLSAAWATAPQALLHEAVVGIHNPEFNDPAATLGQGVTGWRVAAGMFSMPTQWYYGTPGGPMFTARFDINGPVVGEASKGLYRLSVAFNDPDQLTLFPFARNAFAVKLAYDAEF